MPLSHAEHTLGESVRLQGVDGRTRPGFKWKSSLSLRSGEVVSLPTWAWAATEVQGTQHPLAAMQPNPCSSLLKRVQQKKPRCHTCRPLRPALCNSCSHGIHLNLAGSRNSSSSCLRQRRDGGNHRHGTDPQTDATREWTPQSDLEGLQGALDLNGRVGSELAVVLPVPVLSSGSPGIVREFDPASRRHRAEASETVASC